MDAWLVSITVQREYLGKAERRNLFQFSQLVWSDQGLQGALNECVKKFFSAWPSGAVLLPEAALGACRIVRLDSGRHKNYFKSNPSDVIDEVERSTETCSLSINRMPAMSGDAPTEWVSVTDEPTPTAIQVPTSLWVGRE